MPENTVVFMLSIALVLQTVGLFVLVSVVPLLLWKAFKQEKKIETLDEAVAEIYKSLSSKK